MTALQSDRRTRSRQQRRDRVYAAAVELIVERGFEACTMEEIAERADVARATVFNLFQRKVAFLDEWSRLRRQTAFDAVLAHEEADHSLRSGLGRYFIVLARLSAESRIETVAFMGAAVENTSLLRQPALASELQMLLVNAQEAGMLADNADVSLIALSLAVGYFAVLTSWIDDGPHPFDLDARLHSLLNLTLDGALARG